MRIFDLFGQSIRLVLREKLILAPFIAYYLLIQIPGAIGFNQLNPERINPGHFSQIQIAFLIVSLIASELIFKNITITWVAHGISTGRARINLGSARFWRVSIRLIGILGAMLIPLLGLLAIVGNSGLMSSNAGSGIVIGGTLLIWFFFQFASQFVIIEDMPI
ncbi:hypothetical protein EBR96_05375, partial [bacterium]|nr:hypothetical protein [bacterium]